MARQAWNRKGALNRAVLEHARAMLLALAALVERAARLPAVERVWFLAVMANGEAEVRRLIVAMAADQYPGGPAGAAADLPATADRLACSPAIASGDAALLAARFRMLALAVDAMLALAVDAMLAQAGPLSRDNFPSVPFPSYPLRAVAQLTPSPARRATSPP